MSEVEKGQGRAKLERERVQAVDTVKQLEADELSADTKEARKAVASMKHNQEIHVCNIDKHLEEDGLTE